MITIVILAKNEEKNLTALLPTLTWAKQVMVIDDNSTDKTHEIVKKNKAHYVKQLLHDDYASARNKALKRVKTPWALFLDADERLGKKAVKEILTEISDKKAPFDGYKLNRTDIYKGKVLRFGETANVKLLRLGKKNAGLWKRKVHEVWDIKNSGEIKEPIEHYSHKDYASLIKKVTRYSYLEALYRQELGERWSLAEMLFLPLGKFFYNLIYLRGILDGIRGIEMAMAMSYHSFLVRRNQKNLTYGTLGEPGWLIKLCQWIIFLMLFSLPLGQLIRIPLNDNGGIYLFELLMAPLLILWIMYLTGSQKKPVLPSFWLGLGLFSLSLLWSLVHNWTALGVGAYSAGLYLARWWLYAFFWWSLWDMTQRGWFPFPWKRWLFYIGSAWGLLSFIQYIFIPDTRYLFFFGWDDHYYRAIGTLFDPGFNGLMLVLTLVVAEAVAWPHISYANFITFISLMLTYARSAYLVLAMAIAALGIQKKSLKYILTRGLMVALVIWLLPKPGGEGVNLARTYSITSRAKSVLTAVDLFNTSPWFGVGFNAYKTLTYEPNRLGLPVHPSSPDSSFALILATAGIAGIASFMLFIGQLTYFSKNNPVIWISVAVLLVHSATNNSFFYPFALLWLIFLTADLARIKNP